MNQEVFKPVRGTEASILATIPQKGYVYFATDTRKIYYSDGESFLPMGGNTGVWYGKMEYAETPDESQVEFTFQITDLEGNSEEEYHLPNIDDLIFNTPDGCFYRIVEIEESDEIPSLKCNKLTVAGSGGSGGGGGGISNVGYMTLERIGDNTINTLQGNSCYIYFRFTAVDASGESTGQGTATVKVGGIIQEVLQISQGENSIDVGKYLEIGRNNIRLEVSGDIGGSSNIMQSKTWTIISTNLAISWDYDETTLNTEDNITFRWTVSTALKHTIHMDIDGIPNMITETYEANSARDKIYTVSRLAVGLTHGSHLVKMYATAEIGGVEFISTPVTHKVICIDSIQADTIISVGIIPEEMEQYDTLSIPLIFYNPLSTNGLITATLYEDGIEKDRWINYSNGVQYYWNYTPITAGTRTLRITCGTTETIIRLNVNDLGLNVEEVPGYDFKIKASDIISSNALRNWSYGSIVPSFSENFDWINGGLQTELDEKGNIRNYISVKAGNRLSFNYKPFAKDNNFILNNGFTIKVIFKATECRSYDANILNIGTSSDRVYFQLKANEGIYQAIGGASVTIPYCEDSYIELEIDLWPYGNGSQAYLMSWMDGVPATVSTYDSSAYFKQPTPADIVIGSDDCDVQIYMIKIYQNHLTNEQHLSNFIMDAPNSMEIISRYNRNNILDDNGEISYSKLIEKNPNCDVYLYEMDHMTTHKKDDKVKGCTYKRYHGSTIPLQTAENVTMSVQGTSSAAYGLAAFNFDSEFVDGFTDYSKNPDGEHIDKWSMTEKSMPFKYFNTKVNVASCEGANNALNQEWYDRYVPYVTEYHAKYAADSSTQYMPRNTMEFPQMGVVFLKDFNQTTTETGTAAVKNNVFKEIPGYVANPYYKMYAICNMGNSKKNKEAFTDPSNPYDVIMEVSDNQAIQQQMTGGIDAIRIKDEEFVISTVNEKGETVDVTMFEWRNAPKGESITNEANLAWLDLVRWFAENNPSAATGNGLTEPEHYDAYTFKGYTSRADRRDKDGNIMPAYTPELQILKGTTITKYAGDYTTDTYNRRMAKMLSECEDHLIMDEMVFHYLFIERHTLIDNVAKNTFWHTEDLQHWSMIKDYDNDTSDGNDNSGYLTLTYGYEVLDHVDHDETKSMVFNASDSVWLHFIDGLLDARTTMYRYLDNVVTDRDETSIHGAWKAQPYLDKFNAWQSCLPERVWIEDYYRKYLRPYEVYKTDNYLNRLAGGKKTHQRKQYEIYQQNYMASEYFGSEASSSMIDIRANGSNIAEKVFPMTMYADSYICIAAGSGQSPNVRIRARRGETYNVQLPVTGNATDMTTYFFLASYITTLENLEYLKPKTLDISAAYRLKNFSMDRVEGEEYYIKTEDTEINNQKTYYRAIYYPVQNPVEGDFYKYYTISGEQYIIADESGLSFDAQTSYYTFEGYEEVSVPSSSEIQNYYEVVISDSNLNLIRASFVNNRMLENLTLVGCPNIENALDLTAATNLKTLDIRGSGFPSITIASNAPLKTAYLNDPQTLTLNNLYDVETFTFDNVNENNNLAILNLDNVDNNVGLNSKNLVDRILVTNEVNHLVSYDLQNVQWVIDNNDNNEELYIDSENCNIFVLDKLLTREQERKLSGVLEITETAYNGNDSLDFYNKYSVESATRFPNLDIRFTGNNAKLYEVSIANGNDEIVWKRKAKSGYIIDPTFLSSGPYGSFNQAKAIKKTQTEAKEFTFAGSWTVTDSENGTTFTIEGDSPTYDTGLSANILITPNFTETTRRYSVTFIGANGEVLNQDPQVTDKEVGLSYEYGTFIKDTIPPILPSKDSSQLDYYQTYAFLGYALQPNAKVALPLENENYIVNSKDMVYYAIFSDPVDTNSSLNVHKEFFSFNLQGGYSDVEDRFNINGGCYTISPKKLSNNEEVVLTGKVTIPNSYQGYPVVYIGDFRNQSQLTGIFFEKSEANNETKVRSIGAEAFNFYLKETQLKYFEIPDSLRRIDKEAFCSCSLKLLQRNQSMNDTTYYIGGPSSNLYYLGEGAFDSCLEKNFTSLYVSSNISNYNNQSIKNISSANIWDIYFGDANSPSKINIDTIITNYWHVIGLNGGARIEHIYVYLPDSVHYDIIDYDSIFYPFREAEGQGEGYPIPQIHIINDNN